MDKIELTKKETDQISFRMQLLQLKESEIRRLNAEAQIMKDNLEDYLRNTVRKYNEDADADYTFNGSELVKVVKEPKPGMVMG